MSTTNDVDAPAVLSISLPRQALAVRGAALAEKARYAMDAVEVQRREGWATICATDGKGLCRARWRDEGPDLRALVHRDLKVGRSAKLTLELPTRDALRRLLDAPPPSAVRSLEKHRKALEKAMGEAVAAGKTTAELIALLDGSPVEEVAGPFPPWEELWPGPSCSIGTLRKAPSVVLEVVPHVLKRLGEAMGALVRARRACLDPEDDEQEMSMLVLHLEPGIAEIVVEGPRWAGRRGRAIPPRSCRNVLADVAKGCFGKVEWLDGADAKPIRVAYDAKRLSDVASCVGTASGLYAADARDVVVRMSVWNAENAAVVEPLRCDVAPEFRDYAAGGLLMPICLG